MNHKDCPDCYYNERYNKLRGIEHMVMMPGCTCALMSRELVALLQDEHCWSFEKVEFWIKDLWRQQDAED